MGRKLPGYQVLRLLGRGGMGAVYLARAESDGATVAVKVARGDLGDQGLARLRREAELLDRAASPHLPAFRQLVELEKGLALVMAFCEGTPLQAWVGELPPLPERLEGPLREIAGRALPSTFDAIEARLG